MTLDLVEGAESPDVEAGDELLSIGEMARASGLTVSALRFYDGAGVLAPALVDPATGYRWYATRQLPDARLLAGLRRIGMPLADLGRLLDLRGSDPIAASTLLDAHLRRLEDGLADARREITRLRTLLLDPVPDGTPHPPAEPRRVGFRVGLTVPGAELAAAVDAVRFAARLNPALPVLGGVWFEADGHVLRLIATDRYRMAVAELDGVPTRDGPRRAVIAPVGFVDEARALLAESDDPTTGGPTTVSLGTDRISLHARGRRITATPLDDEVPDYRRLLREAADDPAGRRVAVDASRLRSWLATAPARTVVRPGDGARCAVSVLSVDSTGELTVGDGPAERVAEPDVLRIGVNREFLLDALDALEAGDATGGGQLLLDLNGPIRPLAVRLAGNDRAFSILMPVQL
ncbi:MerR family transcriptional regulator [Plantactinospora sp. B24E8]|uniref:DNA polymerase III subunit beta family protein n=1 Tax=Plantactinospora sp. B24E8 TaxID=3153567 RepID=UPI00325E74AA